MSDLLCRRLLHVLVFVCLAAAWSCGSGSLEDAAGEPFGSVEQSVVNAPQWAANKFYAKGALVTFGGIVYECRQAHTSAVGWEPPNVPALWQRPTPSGVAPWTTQTHYVVGSGVTFNGATYQCLQEHVSQSDWTPTKTPSLWRCASKACGGGGCAGLKDGSLCDDGNACTLNDACKSGKCGGTTKTCPAGSECQVTTCDATSGQCGLASKPPGTACGDSQACNRDEDCNENFACDTTENECIPFSALECPIFGQIPCDFVGCTDPNTDSDNCGGCGNRCDPAKSCRFGHCECPFSTTPCSSACVDTNTDSANCGFCGHVCPEDQECHLGNCACKEFGKQICQGVCVDLQTSDSNCGVCGLGCFGDLSCSAGLCGCNDFDKTLRCGSTCVDPHDEKSCGACDRVCPAESSCIGGGICQCNGSKTLCPDGFGGPGTCFDLSREQSHCGTCDNDCGNGATCTNGRCIEICTIPGTAICGSGTSCVDLNSDPSNCGSCFHACFPGEDCKSGKCFACDPVPEFCADLDGDNFCNLGNCVSECSAPPNFVSRDDCAPTSDCNDTNPNENTSCTGCGGEGQACCAGSGCNSGLACDHFNMQNICAQCGGNTQLCCPGANRCPGARAGESLICDTVDVDPEHNNPDAFCIQCGDHFGACCEGARCNDGGACDITANKGLGQCP